MKHPMRPRNTDVTGVVNIIRKCEQTVSSDDDRFATGNEADTDFDISEIPTDDGNFGGTFYPIKIVLSGSYFRGCKIRYFLALQCLKTT